MNTAKFSGTPALNNICERMLVNLNGVVREILPVSQILVTMTRFQKQTSHVLQKQQFTDVL